MFDKDDVYVPTPKKQNVKLIAVYFYSTLTAEFRARLPTLWKCPSNTRFPPSQLLPKPWKHILQVAPNGLPLRKTPKALPPERLSGDVLLGHFDILGAKCGEGIAWKNLNGFWTAKKKWRFGWFRWLFAIQIWMILGSKAVKFEGCFRGIFQLISGIRSFFFQKGLNTKLANCYVSVLGTFQTLEAQHVLFFGFWNQNLFCFDLWGNSI